MKTNVPADSVDGPTLMDVVKGTPAGQTAVQGAMERSARVMELSSQIPLADFTYQNDGYTIPILSIYAELSPIEQEAFRAYIARHTQQAVEAAYRECDLEAAGSMRALLSTDDRDMGREDAYSHMRSWAYNQTLRTSGEQK